MNHNPSTFNLIKNLLYRYPKRTAFVVFSFLLASVVESIGIASLLPLINVSIGSGAANDSTLNIWINKVFSFFGFEPTLLLLLILIVGLMVIKAVFTFFAMRHVGYTSAHLASDYQLNLFDALLKARWDYFINKPTGSLVNAIITEAERSSSSYVMLCKFISNIIQIIAYSLLALLLSWYVTIAALVVGAFILLTLGRLIQMGRESGKKQTEMLKSISSRLSDILHGIKPLKAMATENRLKPILEADVEALKKSNQKQIVSKFGLTAFQEPIIVLALAAGILIVMTVWQVHLDSLMVLGILFWKTIKNIGMLQGEYQFLARSESAYWSLNDAIEKARNESEDLSGEVIPRLEKEIRFSKVYFSYGETDILSGVDLTIKNGSFITLVGSSGAGKTTVADLIVGLFRPQSGDIWIDNISLAKVDMRAWRAMIGYVPQETMLFHDTIYRNVTLGDPTLTLLDVETALKASECWEFVSSLPDGMNAIVGERGTKISGGQRQRISIARALVRKPKLLVLDEVTTSLDPKTAVEVCNTLRRLQGSTTIFAISHQPELMEVSDQIYIVKDCKIERLHKGRQALNNSLYV